MDNNTISTENLKSTQDIIKKYQPIFLKLINERLGIALQSHQTSALEKTILSACIKFNCSPYEYLQIIKSCSSHSPLLDYLVCNITIGETYFFRDKKQMHLLQTILLPDLIKRKQKENNLTLRIWSAGCASGEEIYTIAMLLNELIDDLSLWTLNLLATDINTNALEKAITARFTEWSMRSISTYFRERYFAKENDQYSITDSIKQLVKFNYLNLHEDTYPSMFNGTNAQDLILCRNVLIYFDNNNIIKIMHKLAESLVPGGYLLLGASDPINISNTDLTYHYEYGPVFCRTDHEINSKSILTLSNKEKKPIISFSDIDRTKESNKISASKLPNSFIFDEELITNLLQKNNWHKVIELIDLYPDKDKNSLFCLNAKATSLANLGKLTDAEMFYGKCFLLDSTNKYIYFNYALTLIEHNKLDAAEKALHQALFLDHQFVVGHYQLGLLLLRVKQKSAGLKSLRNALAIAKLNPESKIVPGSQGILFGSLVTILENELKLYEKLGNEYANQNQS